MPVDHSRLAESVDVLHVAVGLHLVAVALLGATPGKEEGSDLPHLLVVVDDDPPRAACRASHLPYSPHACRLS
jgi:hypothetical protein